MADTTITKVQSAHSPRGPEGELYLASGKRLSMRLWRDEAPTEAQPRRRDYETVGYVVSGLPLVGIHAGSRISPPARNQL